MPRWYLELVTACLAILVLVTCWDLSDRLDQRASDGDRERPVVVAIAGALVAPGASEPGVR